GPIILGGSTSTRTDKDGRFRLTGFGRDRVASLMVRGQGIEYADYKVIARVGPAEGLRLRPTLVHAVGDDFTVRPSKPIVGTVRHKKTGKPLSGIRVGSPTTGTPGGTTDEKGQYRIDGVGKQKEYTLAAAGRSYFNSTKFHILDTQGLDPLVVDFEMER